MKRLPGITSVELKTGFREKMVEKFVKNNLPPQIRRESKTGGMGIFSTQYSEVDYCAAELPVQGVAEVFFAVKNNGAIHHISSPVTSRFIVFCTRKDNSDYKVAWTSSLS